MTMCYTCSSAVRQLDMKVAPTIPGVVDAVSAIAAASKGGPAEKAAAAHLSAVLTDAEARAYNREVICMYCAKVFVLARGDEVVVYDDEVEKAASCASPLEPVDTQKQTPRIRSIYLCPQHTRAWITGAPGILRKSVIMRGIYEKWSTYKLKVGGDTAVGRERVTGVACIPLDHGSHGPRM